MKRRLRSYAQALVGLGLAIGGWAIEQGMERWQDIDWFSLPLAMVAGGVLLAWLGQTPGDAKYDDEKGQ